MEAVERLTGGQLNTALRINRGYVLRCREAARATGSLAREAAVVEAVAIYGVGSLAEAVGILSGQLPAEPIGRIQVIGVAASNILSPCLGQRAIQRRRNPAPGSG